LAKKKTKSVTNLSDYRNGKSLEKDYTKVMPIKKLTKEALKSSIEFIKRSEERD
jgi:hypothetical protein